MIEKDEQVSLAKEIAVDLDDPKLYINRELSLLEFQRRVLEEALDESNPLLERVKFLAILGSNLDEFFMVRVSGLEKQLDAGILDVPPDGLTPCRATCNHPQDSPGVNDPGTRIADKRSVTRPG